MPHLQRDPGSGRFRIRFRFGGIEYKRSLKTTDPREANNVLGAVDEMIRLLERGRLSVPEDVDPGTYIVNNGRPGPNLAEKSHLRTLRALFTANSTSSEQASKEPTTVEGECRHQKHLLRHLGAGTSIRSLTASDIQRYVDARSQDRWRKRFIGSETIKKELTTLRLIWNWGVRHGHLATPPPIKGVKLTKPDQKRPFMTSAEIESVITRGGLSDREQLELWNSLFLGVVEVESVLNHVERFGRQSFIYPMFVFAAHTGARRSEIIRSRVEDLDFDARIVRIREKKRVRSRAMSYRQVDMTDRFARVFNAWVQRHPSSNFTICSEYNNPITSFQATDHFKRTLKGSKWARIRGFHVFRHSFASNAAAAGIDQRIIDEWMGHQTDEMRCRYRHLFPEQRRNAIQRVFQSEVET